MPKRLLHIVIALLGAFALFLVSCTDGTNSEQRVSVTIQPQRYIAEQIAGDRFLINCVVPAGSNPEAYDPTPRQLIEIDRSEAYLKVGGMLGFEVAWLQRLSQNNPDMKIYDTSQGVAMLTSTHHHKHDNGVEHVAEHALCPFRQHQRSSLYRDHGRNCGRFLPARQPLYPCWG